MADSKQGRHLHQLVEEARESGNFLKALELSDQATLTYQKDQDLLGLSEVQSSRQSIFKQLYRTTNDESFLILEKHAAKTAVEIAEKSEIKEALGIPFHNLGKYYFEVGEFAKAEHFFKMAIENLINYPSERHSRQSVIADIKGHLHAAEYHAGNKTALNSALDALRELKKTKEKSTYHKNVWISGAHLRIAGMLIKDNLRLTKEHLSEARKIIEKDKRLILRKNQLEKFEKKLNA